MEKNNKKLIEKLTPEQEKMLPVYEKKWLDIGLSTEKANRPAAEKAILNIYKKEGLAAPEFVWFDSPLEILDHFKRYYPEEVENIMNNWVYGNHEAHWLAFYEFFLVEVGLECCKPIEDFIEIAKNMNWWISYDTHCFCSEKPNKIVRKEDGTLHCESGPAISYKYTSNSDNPNDQLLKDAVEMYYLNGVKVTKELVMTPAEKLDAKLILTEKNAEVRREIVRKIGIERVCEQLDAKVIDEKTIEYKEPVYSETETYIDEDGRTQRTIVDYKVKESPYQLILLDIGKENGVYPYLKMLNPSIGTYHIEGVHPDCKTVEEAIAWRNGTKKIPKTLT